MAEPVTIAMLPEAARFSVRGDGSAAAALGYAFGLDVPQDPCRSATAGDRTALWLGPDEWLLLAPDGEAEALTATLSEALRSTPGSVVDISDRQVAIAVTGAKAAEALNAFNALDLDESAFPVGMCTRTLFGKAEIVLWRTAPDAFHVEVWRSFAPYVLGCLDEARREYA
jgi:sarcosine oxidase subunit gamma